MTLQLFCARLNQTARVFFALAALTTPLNTSADLHGKSLPLSVQEFKSLAAELSHKVNLFRDVWDSDPQAEFFGGTARDYLYWLKGQLRNLTTREEAMKVIGKLRGQPLIDVRSFIFEESDVDIASDRGLSVRASDYGVRKIDLVSRKRFDPSTPEGFSELHQGFIPIEKIRLSRKGFVVWEGMGDGVSEIFRSRPTVRFAPAEEFLKTRYAASGLNHPVLLALRYLRVLALGYFQNHGSGYPNQSLLFNIDPDSEKATREVIARSLGGELRDYMKKPQFRKWLNASVQKAFRSYTNPTAALLLMKHFGADMLPRIYEGIEPINQYLFAKHRNHSNIEKNLRKYRVDTEAFFHEPGTYFPNGLLYHGTSTEPAFRNILMQGILPSTDGSAGEGLYGVSEKHLHFAEEWGGSRDRVVSFVVKPSARIVDVTHGEGRRVHARFGGDIEAFCEAFGIDILRYPYTPEAFVVKNSAALGSPAGLTRTPMRLDDAMRAVASLRTVSDLTRFAQSLDISGFTSDEIRFLSKHFAQSTLSVAMTPEQGLALARGLEEFATREKGEGRILFLLSALAETRPDCELELHDLIRKDTEALRASGGPPRFDAKDLIELARKRPSLKPLIKSYWLALCRFGNETLAAQMQLVFQSPEWLRDLDLIEALITRYAHAPNEIMLGWFAGGMPMGRANAFNSALHQLAQYPVEQDSARFLNVVRTLFETKFGTVLLFDRYNVRALLGRPDVSTLPFAEEWAIRAIRIGVYADSSFHTLEPYLDTPRIASELIAAHEPQLAYGDQLNVPRILLRPSLANHVELVRELIDTARVDGVLDFFVRDVLTAPTWIRQPDWASWMEEVIRQEADNTSGRRFNEIIDFLHKVPESGQHPEWLEAIFDRKESVARWKKANLDSVLSTPHWKNSPALRTFLGGSEPTSELLLAAFKEGKSFGGSKNRYTPSKKYGGSAKGRDSIGRCIWYLKRAFR